MIGALIVKSSLIGNVYPSILPVTIPVVLSIVIVYLPFTLLFCGKLVPTRRNEMISVRLNNVDSEEGVFLN